MTFDESTERILSRIDLGDVDTAIDMVDQAQEEFGSEATYLIYAQPEIRHLAWRYKTSGEWKSARSTYAESLLSADITDRIASYEIAIGLKHYGYLLRFLYRDKQAIPILEATTLTI